MADNQAIKQAVNLVDWDGIFANLSVNRRWSTLKQPPGNYAL